MKTAYVVKVEMLIEADDGEEDTIHDTIAMFLDTQMNLSYGEGVQHYTPLLDYQLDLFRQPAIKVKVHNKYDPDHPDHRMRVDLQISNHQTING